MIREFDDRRESASTGLHLAKPKGGHGHCEYWLVSGWAAWSSTFSVSWSCSFLSSAKYADSDWFRMRRKSCVCSASLMQGAGHLSHREHAGTTGHFGKGQHHPKLLESCARQILEEPRKKHTAHNLVFVSSFPT